MLAVKIPIRTRLTFDLMKRWITLTTVTITSLPFFIVYAQCLLTYLFTNTSFDPLLGPFIILGVKQPAYTKRL